MDTSLLLVIVLVIHVFGAVFGFGPSVAYAVLGPAAGKASPQGGLAIMEAMIAIEKRLILPFAVAIQPLSGLALIFLAGYNVNFFGHYWLWIAILLYAAAFYLAILVQTPLLEKMVHIVKAGPPTPEFMAATKRTQQLGPVITILLALIVILMVAKPGGLAADSINGVTSRRVILVAVVAVIVFVLDRITKNAVDASIPLGSSVEVVGEWVRISHVTNTGAAFGLLPGGTALLSVLSVVAVFAIVFYYRRLAAGSPLIAVTLGMQLGGAFGNLVDRIGQGHVVDFVDVGIPGGPRFWAFNVADSSIVVGIIAVTALLWWQERQQPRDLRHA